MNKTQAIQYMLNWKGNKVRIKVSPNAYDIYFYDFDDECFKFASPGFGIRPADINMINGNFLKAEEREEFKDFDVNNVGYDPFKEEHTKDKEHYLKAEKNFLLKEKEAIKEVNNLPEECCNTKCENNNIFYTYNCNKYTSKVMKKDCKGFINQIDAARKKHIEKENEAIKECLKQSVLIKSVQRMMRQIKRE
jgi:hypothetical protein